MRASMISLAIFVASASLPLAEVQAQQRLSARDYDLTECYNFFQVLDEACVSRSLDGDDRQASLMMFMQLQKMATEARQNSEKAERAGDNYAAEFQGERAAQVERLISQSRWYRKN